LVSVLAVAQVDLADLGDQLAAEVRIDSVGLLGSLDLEEGRSSLEEGDRREAYFGSQGQDHNCLVVDRSLDRIVVAVGDSSHQIVVVEDSLGVGREIGLGVEEGLVVREGVRWVVMSSRVCAC
jgi:hypothetical protein